MKYLHLASFLTAANKKWQGFARDFYKTGVVTSLESFWKKPRLLELFELYPDAKVFLDSGAHTLLNVQAGVVKKDRVLESEENDNDFQTLSQEEFDNLSQELKIQYGLNILHAPQFLVDPSFNDKKSVRKYLDDYIEFIHKYKNNLIGYVNLDIIYNAEESWKNQQYMEKAGLRPIPVFHYGEDFKWFYKYAEEYDYVGIGGVAGGITLQQFEHRLGIPVFQYIREKRPDLKTHGFAVTSVNLMKRYPWYSVDSITWLKLAAFGQVLVPPVDPKTEEWDFLGTPKTVHVSQKSPRYYRRTCTPYEVTQVERFIKEASCEVEEVETVATARLVVNTYFFLCVHEKINQAPLQRSNRRFM